MRFTDHELTGLGMRAVWLSTRGPIDGDMQRYVTAAILYLNALDPVNPITLYIDSTGGHLHAQLSIIDVIRMSRAPIIGVVTGYAGSSAFNILQFCTVRKAYPFADLMFHAVDGSGVRMDHPKRKKIIEESERRQRELIAVLGRRSGQRRSRLIKWSRDERNFTAKEALKCGLIDEIIPYVHELPKRNVDKNAT